MASGALWLSTRYNFNLSRTQSAIAKYADAEIWLFGHSLGGSIASKIGSTIPHCHVVTYNKGAGIGTLLEQAWSNPNEIAYRITGDILSVGAKSHGNVRNLIPSTIITGSLHDDRWRIKSIPFFSRQATHRPQKTQQNFLSGKAITSGL